MPGSTLKREVGNVLLVYWSSSAYNITTGLPGPRGGGFAVPRLALLNLPADACAGSTMKYTMRFRCFDL